MGEYAPDDQRMVHKNAGPDHSMSDWHRREQEEQQQEQQQDDGAQPGYGNARNESGQMEQDVATGDLGNQSLAQGPDGTEPGEISQRPDERALADANRPLGSA